MEKYLYVFDYCLCEINEIPLFDNKYIKDPDDINAAQLIKDYGMNPEQCAWMFSTERLEIEPLNND